MFSSYTYYDVAVQHVTHYTMETFSILCIKSIFSQTQMEMYWEGEREREREREKERERVRIYKCNRDIKWSYSERERRYMNTSKEVTYIFVSQSKKFGRKKAKEKKQHINR